MSHILKSTLELDQYSKLKVTLTGQCGKMKKLLSLKKKFRQINSVVSSLVETLFSRNFCQRCVTVKLRIFDKNFVKVKFFLKRRLDEIFLVIVNFSFFHTVQDTWFFEVP